MDKKTQKNQLSFADAFTFLKKFRYKPRNEWTKEEEQFLKFVTLLSYQKRELTKHF